MKRSTSRKSLLYCSTALGGLLLLLIASPAVRSAEPGTLKPAKAKHQDQGQDEGQLTAVGKELLRVEGEIDKIFADALAQSKTIPNDSGHRLQQIQTLGTLLLFDRQLSVFR